MVRDFHFVNERRQAIESKRETRHILRTVRSKGISQMACRTCPGTSCRLIYLKFQKFWIKGTKQTLRLPKFINYSPRCLRWSQEARPNILNSYYFKSQWKNLSQESRGKLLISNSRSCGLNRVEQNIRTCKRGILALRKMLRCYEASAQNQRAQKCDL